MFNIFNKITKKRIKIWEKNNQTSKILPAINSDTYSIRIAAIQSLGNIGDKSTLPDLIKLLDHKNNFIRKEVATSLLKIDSTDSVRRVISEKEDNWTKKRNASIKKNDSPEFDKDFYSWKGRFSGNITRTKAIKEKLKRPMRWG